ncbi:hypothetical protein CAOG_008367 [Capsaspora owczarzaki ATCC 30864]|uniref:DNA-directed DNA polymerase n=2 Tax=Capsaspora owczarzaki (strain ATCC 30864) TaxID=595528 RepID=A0A0D2W233_CAPO3|nr:hypothetical protein CAOG_008367 [Capsaspora owczarzaki ATCC 30864]
MLNGLGIVTCEDMFAHRYDLFQLFSPISFDFFLRVSLGAGSSRYEEAVKADAVATPTAAFGFGFAVPDNDRKSISVERTFREINTPTALLAKCEELCHKLAADVNSCKLRGRTVTVKLKMVDFRMFTRAASSQRYISSASEMFELASKILQDEIQQSERAGGPLRLRLMGVRLSALVTEPPPPSSSSSISNTIGSTPGAGEGELLDSTPSTAHAKASGIERFFALSSRHLTSEIEARNASKDRKAAARQRQRVCSNDAIEISDDSDAEDGDNDEDDWAAVAADSASLDNASHPNGQQVGTAASSRGALPSLGSAPVSNGRIHTATTMYQAMKHRLTEQTAAAFKRPRLDPSAADSSSTAANTPSQPSHVCPICQRPQVCQNLVEFTDHVDECLTKQTIKRILQHDDQQQQQQQLGRTGVTSGTTKR